MIGKLDHNKYKICAHEAGHAFYAKLSGRVVSKIILQPDGSAFTRIEWGDLSPIEAAFLESPRKILEFNESAYSLYLNIKSSILVAGPICELLPKHNWSFDSKNLSIEASGQDLALINTLERELHLNVDQVMRNVSLSISELTIPSIRDLANLLYTKGEANQLQIDSIFDPLLSKFKN